MFVKHFLRVTIIASMCAVMCTGCKTCNPKDDSGENLAPTDVLGGDHPLKYWDETGSKITNVTFESVMFDFDSAQIRRSECSKIEGVAAYLKRNPQVRAIMEGHCDERGTGEYNLLLGERRALAVRAYLIGLEINAIRVTTKSYGEEKPLDPGHGENSWRANRRVEFALYR